MSIAAQRTHSAKAGRANTHSLNEQATPVSEDIFGRMASAEPKDAAAIAAELPLDQRARLAAFCYARRHTNHLGLLIASTCDRMALRRAMGMAGDVLFKQSRNVEETIAAEQGRRDDAGKITLASAANVVAIGRAKRR